MLGILMLILKIVELKIIKKIYDKLSEKKLNKILRAVIVVALYVIITVFILYIVFYVNESETVIGIRCKLYHSSETIWCNCFSPARKDTKFSEVSDILLRMDRTVTVISFLGLSLKTLLKRKALGEKRKHLVEKVKNKAGKYILFRDN